MNRRLKTKHAFMALAIWRKLVLAQKSFLFHATRKLIFSRGSSIPKLLVNRRAFIHTGRKFKRRFLSKWCVGFKYGSLTWNRRLAIYKAKQLRKKKVKKNKIRAFIENILITFFSVWWENIILWTDPSTTL